MTTVADRLIAEKLHRRTRRERGQTVSRKDVYRERLYQAETWARITRTAEDMSLAEAEAYIVELLADPKVVAEFTTQATGPIQVTGTGRGAYAVGGLLGYRINLPGWARNEGVILHEVAHVFVGRLIGHAETKGHGREFVTVYRWLVKHRMGAAAEKRLVKELRARKVPVGMKRILSDAEHRALAERARKVLVEKSHAPAVAAAAPAKVSPEERAARRKEAARKAWETRRAAAAAKAAGVTSSATVAA